MRIFDLESKRMDKWAANGLHLCGDREESCWQAGTREGDSWPGRRGSVGKAWGYPSHLVELRLHECLGAVKTEIDQRGQLSFRQ